MMKKVLAEQASKAITAVAKSQSKYGTESASPWFIYAPKVPQELKK